MPGDVSGAGDAAAVLAMDEGTFAGLAERHRHELRVHCYRMLGSFTDAEDVVQEALLRAWRRRETFAGRATFRAWLYQIATNACLDALDSPARKREVAVTVTVTADAGGERSPVAEVTWLQPYPDRLLDQAAPDGGEPEALVVARETIELAYLAAVQHLPPRQRAVLILRDVLGWPAAETATALELSVPSVKSALQRARGTLRAQLPERRLEWTSAARPSEEERAVVRRLVAATEQADADALAALLREDARQTMPPDALLYLGRQAILDLWTPVMTGPDAWGDWRVLPTTANRQPAVANYVRLPGEARFTPVNLDVLLIEGGQIAEITTFGPDVLPAFGLPAEL